MIKFIVMILFSVRILLVCTYYTLLVHRSTMLIITKSQQ